MLFTTDHWKNILPKNFDTKDTFSCLINHYLLLKAANVGFVRPSVGGSINEQKNRGQKSSPGKFCIVLLKNRGMIVAEGAEEEEEVVEE